MWKKIASKTLLDHPRMKVIEDDIILHTGEESKYIKIDYNGHGAGIIAVREDGKILVQTEYSYPIGHEVYQFPGGMVPEGEDIKEGAQRELIEETGLKAGTLNEIGWFYPMNRRSASRAHIFFATNFTKDFLPADSEEKIETHWMTEEEIDQLIAEGHIVNASALAAWCLYKANKDRLS